MQPDGVDLQRLAVSRGVTLQIARGQVRSDIPLVFLPAFADSWWSWSRILPSLAADFDVLAIDARGHGGSDRPACCYRVDDVAADVVAALDALEIARAVVVGHSGSCFAARRVAVEHGGRVAALVLIASPLTLDRSRLATFIEGVAALEDPVPEAFVRSFQSGAAHLRLPEAFFEGVIAESRRMPAQVWRDVLDGLLDFDDMTELGSIRQPTTLVWGDKDQIVPKDEQRRLAAAIPDSSLVILANTGHSPHWERPEIVIELLEHVAAAEPG